MTVTVPMWAITALIILAGIVIARRVGRTRGDFDMVSPILGLLVFLGAIIVALILNLVVRTW